MSLRNTPVLNECAMSQYPEIIYGTKHFILMGCKKLLEYFGQYHKMTHILR